MLKMLSVPQNINNVRQRIVHAARKAGQNEHQITLLAVSKRHSTAAIRAAYDCGLRQFGENYLQEALQKIDELAQLDITWHFIGSIQSNKTRAIAENFHWVHTVDRMKIATRLAQQRPENVPPLNICLQVNIDDEDTKSGASSSEIVELAKYMSALPRLRLRGLMCIPSKSKQSDRNKSFGATQALFDDVNRELALPHWDTLSMGMSSDLEAAIANHANIVRIGTDIFGPRDSA